MLQANFHHDLQSSPILYPDVGTAACRFTASDVMLVGPAKVPAVRLYVFGESFMFNMIRHMVGMAVAVSRGALPLQYVHASLAMSALCSCGPPTSLALKRCMSRLPSRHAHSNCSPFCWHRLHVARCRRLAACCVLTCMSCSVPLAPPHTLVLSSNIFRNFRTPVKGAQSPAVSASGNSLALREGGTALRDEFVDTTLSAGLGSLLDPSLPAWQSWVAALDHTAVDEEATEKWLQEFEVWSAQVERNRAERAAQKDAEAQAAAGAAVQLKNEGSAQEGGNADHAAEAVHVDSNKESSEHKSQGTVVAG